MLDTLFLLETDSAHWLTELSAPFPDACRQANWLDMETNYGCSVDLNGHQARHVVPIGSIEFVNAFLRQRDMKPLMAMNIPSELEQPAFLRRCIFRNVLKTDIPALEAEYGPLLIKPAEAPKRFEMTRSDNLSNIPDDEPLFVSQEIREPIIAEWRIFLFRGRLISIKPYVLDKWVCPNQTIIQKMCAALQQYPALALDVGVLSGGNTVVIECHPFISCGLYGFDGPDMIKMAKAAWIGELNRQART